MNRLQNRNAKWILSMPTLIFVVVCVSYPLLYTLYLSFHSWKMSASVAKEWVGLSNYIRYFSDERFRGALWRTLYYTFCCVSIESILGIIFALILDKVKKGSNVIRTVFLMPMVATPVAVGMLWKLILDPTIGLANQILKFLGLPVSTWLGSSETVMMSLAIIDIWQWTPNIMLLVLAGLSGMDGQVLESARVDGANEWQTITKITIPILMPTIMMSIMLRLIDCLKTFDIIYSTTLGGPGYSSENLNILSYRTAFEYFQMGNASALLIVFFIVVCGFALLFSVFRKMAERKFE